MKELFSLESDRIRLIEASPDDADFIIDLVNQEGWLKYIGDRKIHDQDSALEYINKGLCDSYQKNGFGLWIVILREFNVPIGICGFLQRDFLDSPDIGFAFLSHFEKQGYAIEAASRCIRYGQEKLGFSTIHAITHPNNIKSQGLLDKLGMHFSEILIDQNGAYLFTLHLS